MFVSQPITFPIIAIMCACLSSTVQACGAISSVQHTFYGFPDNDPPGPATAFNCGGRNFVAGGSGTFSDPLTMATAPNEFSQCETLYVPYLKKYVRFEDTCAQCTEDFKSGKRHIDIWTGSPNINGGQKQINCEDQLTPDGNGEHTIIRFPAGNLAVDGKSGSAYDQASSR